MRLRNLFRRRRQPATPVSPHRPEPSCTTRQNGERELRGHSSIVYRLATVPTADGVLLASGDTQGAVLLWDGASGKPLTNATVVDDVTVADLAAVRQRDGGWMLACCGAASVTLVDPSRIGEPDYEPHRFLDTGGSAMAVVPGEPQLLVLADADAVRVIEPDTGQQVFAVRQPPSPKGHIGDKVYRLAGVRFDAGTAGFAAGRYGGTTELWEQVGDAWRRRDSAPGVLGGGVFTGFGTQLAITARRGIDVWDLQAGGRTVRGDLDTPFEALAPVSLGQRTVIAAAFREYQECGVQLWDPQQPATLGAAFNLHGPAFGDPSFGAATINAVTSIDYPDGSTRVASAGNDACVLVSAPLDEHDLVEGQRPGRPQETGANFAKVRTTAGEIVGFWFADTAHAQDRMLIEAVLFREDLQHLLGARHRVVSNAYDDHGGAFVMFGDEPAPGEPGYEL